MLWNAPTYADPDRSRRAQLAMMVVRISVGAAVLIWGSALLNPTNDPLIATAFYVPVLSVAIFCGVLIRRGHETAAGWVLTVGVFAAVTAATLLFGGLSSQNATAYIVAMMIAGTTIDGRAAIAVAVASFVGCAVAAYLQANDLLPAPLVPPSAMNALTAMGVPLILTAILLHRSLAGLQNALRRGDLRERERDEAQARLVHAQKLEVVGRLSAGIAHDVNNLLTVMRGTSELLRFEAQDHAMSEELIDDLDATIRRVALLSGKLLAFSRSRSSTPEDLDLAEVAGDLLDLLERLLGDRVHLVRDIPATPVYVRAPRSAIEQVTLNLTVNARDAMPHGGTLAVRIASDDGHAILEVRDDGIGMDPATKSRIFEPFFTTKDTGTGLGLATVKAIVDELGGDIELSSQAEQGTVFRVRLPRVDAPSAPQASHPLADRAGVRSGRILVVEDDADVRRSLQRVLEASGYRVATLTDGREALALVDAGISFDAIVSDVMMPHVTGDELARHIQERDLDVALVLMSGRADGEAPYGVRVRFLRKPFEIAQLLDALDELVPR